MNGSHMLRILPAALVAAVILTVVASAGAQTPAPQNTAAIFINGTVRDESGALVRGATVILEEKTRSESVEGKTLADGTFSFLALKGGTYVVRVRMAGFRQFATEPMQLSPSDKKQLDLVLQAGNGDGEPNSSAAKAEEKTRGSMSDLKVRPPTQGKPNEMEFSDAPNFTVAGVTDWSNAGLHASETNARTSESLNKDMAALKAGASGGKKELARQAAPLQKNGHAAEANPATGADTPAPAAEAETHRAAGDRYEAAGDALAAEREYEAAVRLGPSEANYFAWGTELLVHKAIQPAVEVFTKGASVHPESWRMLVGLGAALYASGSYEDAARRVCQASDLQPGDVVPYLFLGKMQKSATDSLPCVEEKLARFLRAQSENALANYYYAVALWKRARGAESPADLRKQEALLQKAVRADPKLADAYLQLGILYEAQNGWELAVRAYKQAITAHPQLGEAHYRLGLAYKRAGDQTKAAQEFALYKQAQEAQAGAEEQQRKELQQFAVILKEKDKKD